MKWIKKLEIKNVLYCETLDEYMASYEEAEAKIEQFDKRIGEISEQAKYHEWWKYASSIGYKARDEDFVLEEMVSSTMQNTGFPDRRASI